MNRELRKLYEGKYPVLSKEISLKNRSLNQVDRATNPLLIQIDDNYARAKFKVMIFGQETNVWFGEKKNGEFLGRVDEVIELYTKFYLSNRCFSYGGQFWNGINRFRLILEKELETNIGLVWNNVLKIGKCGKGAPFSSIQDIQFRNFNVIRQEIDLLQPNLLMFFSGPNYDEKIKRSLGNLNRKSFEGFTDRQMCQFRLDCNVMAFRTYHPNYLWRNNIDNYFSVIAKKIRGNLS
ncbi:MAG: hypothetical protein H6598_02740 [Flavobacteriales bacterium]|nr:hypothetical protein [Flavobacteriales bacterium]